MRGAARDAVERARRGGALMRAPQCAAHLYGIGLILSDALNEVARTFDRVRETRFAETRWRARSASDNGGARRDGRRTSSQDRVVTRG